MLAFSWEEAINTCSHASAVVASLVAAASPPVTRTAKTRVAASCRRVETQSFTGSESTAPANTQTQMSTRNEYPNEPFTRWRHQRTRHRVPLMQPPAPPLTPAPTPPPFPATPPARRSRRRWWLFGCGGCGAIALIVVLVVVVVLINGFRNSPLRQFPTEAGASTVSDNFLVGTGGQNGETLVIDDPHSLTDGETFYQSALDTNGWAVQATDPSQAASGDSWQFSQTGSSAQFDVTFVSMGSTTEITVQSMTGGAASTPLPTSQGVDSSVTALMLTATEASGAVSGALPVSRFIDAEIGGQAGTDMRSSMGSDGELRHGGQRECLGLAKQAVRQPPLIIQAL